MQITFWEAARAVSATNDWQQWPDFNLASVEMDSRLVSAGTLFVPLKGNLDGHQFVEKARENGAVASFWSMETPAPKDFPVLQVADTLVAMQDLARYYLEKMQPDVIAITGSNGKTTTKDMTEAVLAQKFVTYKTQGNYNNEIGLPYTILHMPDTTEKLILEMGMDHAGEIGFLSELAQPHVAAITMIGEAHIENLGSKAGIAAAKMEIAQGLRAEGLLLLPNEEPLLVPLAQALPQTKQTFGWEDTATYCGELLQADKDQTTFRVNQKETVFQLPVPGRYNVQNALIAIGIAQWFGVPTAQIQAGLATFQLTKNRTQWLKNAKGLELLSDVYNANPTAVKLVLDSFSEMPTTGKRLVVLGDMLELGSESAHMHRELAEHLAADKIQEVFLYGTEMAALAEALRLQFSDTAVHHYPVTEKATLIADLQATGACGDMILLKGSNGMGLNEVVTALMEN